MEEIQMHINDDLSVYNYSLGQRRAQDFKCGEGFLERSKAALESLKQSPL